MVIGKPPGYDRVRNAEIGNKDFELDVLEEAYTTEHWLVRIYKVKNLPNRGVWLLFINRTVDNNKMVGIREIIPRKKYINTFFPFETCWIDLH